MKKSRYDIEYKNLQERYINILNHPLHRLTIASLRDNLPDESPEESYRRFKESLKEEFGDPKDFFYGAKFYKSVEEANFFREQENRMQIDALKSSVLELEEKYGIEPILPVYPPDIDVVKIIAPKARPILTVSYYRENHQKILYVRVKDQYSNEYVPLGELLSQYVYSIKTLMLIKDAEHQLKKHENKSYQYGEVHVQFDSTNVIVRLNNFTDMVEITEYMKLLEGFYIKITR